MQREQNLLKDRGIFELNNRIIELDQQLQRTKMERDRLVNICSGLKADLNNLQNRMTTHDEYKEGVPQKNRIIELENYVKELSKQIERMTGKNIIESEEQKLEIEGVNTEQFGRPQGPPITGSRFKRLLFFSSN